MTDPDEFARMLVAAAAHPRLHDDGSIEWALPDGRRMLSRPWVDPRGRLQMPVAPGIYRDADQSLHFNVLELLALVQLPDTPAHRASVLAMLRESAVEHHATLIVDDGRSQA
jgi:hypothetical protein